MEKHKENSEDTCGLESSACKEIYTKSKKRAENQLTLFEKLIGQKRRACRRDPLSGLWSL